MLILVALAYRPAIDGAFIWDDHILAAEDAAFRHAPASKIMLSSFWPEGGLADARAPYYRPLVLLSLRLDGDLGGTADQFHITNILLHLLGCVFLATAASRLGAKPAAAILAALVWGVAPRLTESVAWIAGRTDVLAGVLGLGALTLSPELAETAPRTHALRGLRSILAGICLFGALCSKEIAIAFVFTIIAGAARRGAFYDRYSSLRLGAYVGVPAVVYLGLRHVALAGKSVALRDLGAERRAATVLEALGRYVEMTVDALRPRTSIGILGEVDTGRAVLGAMILGAAGVAAVIMFRRRTLSPAAAVWMTLWTVSTTLVLHIVPFTLAGSVTADRLLYVPLAALAIGAATSVSAASRTVRTAAAVMACALAGLFAHTTKARAAEYRDEPTFWVSAAEHAHPHNTMPRSVLAGLVSDAGEVELACRLYEKSQDVLAATERAGMTAHRRTRENLAACWARIGRYEDSLRLSEELVREYPDIARVHMGLGFARLHVRDFDGASAALARARELDPGLGPYVADVLRNLGKTRRDWERFQHPEARMMDKLGWANHLASVGRAPEANEGFLAVAEDPASTPIQRGSATNFLILEGPYEMAERAFATHESPADDAWARVMSERLAQRRARRARVLTILPRAEALAR